MESEGQINDVQLLVEIPVKQENQVDDKRYFYQA